MERRNITDSPMEIYVHIPFCIKKCDYCDFLSVAFRTKGAG